MLCIKLPERAPKQAATIAASYMLAHATAQAFEYALQWTTAVTNSGFSGPGVSILVTGDKTAISAILCLLLKTNHPDGRTFVTADLPEREDLVKRVGQYVLSFRAHYAIDANSSDTIEHLQSEFGKYTEIKHFDGLIDITEFVYQVPRIASILEEKHVFVNATAVAIGDAKEIMASLRSFMDVNASHLTEL